MCPFSPDFEKEIAIPGRTPWPLKVTWAQPRHVLWLDCSHQYRSAEGSGYWALVMYMGWTAEVGWSCPRIATLEHSRFLALKSTNLQLTLRTNTKDIPRIVAIPLRSCSILDLADLFPSLHTTSPGVCPYLFLIIWQVQEKLVRKATMSSWPNLHAKCSGVSRFYK